MRHRLTLPALASIVLLAGACAVSQESPTSNPASSAATGAASEDWPCFRGPRHDGTALVKGTLADWPTTGPRLLWKAAIGDSSIKTDGWRGTGGAAVSGGRVFVANSAAGKGQTAIFCLDAKTGESLWKVTHTSANQSRAAGCVATPAIVGQRAYFYLNNGIMLCLDTKDGAKVWERDLFTEYKVPDRNRPEYGYSSSPWVEDGMLFCQVGGVGASVVALKTDTGAEVWKSGDDAASQSSPQIATIGGAKQVLVLNDQAMNGFDFTTGKLLWRIADPDEGRKNIAQPFVVDDYVYFRYKGAVGRAAVTRQGDEWEATIDPTWKPHDWCYIQFASPIPAGDWAYFDNNAGQFVCMSIRNGSMPWSFAAPGSPVLLDATHIVLQRETGEVVLLGVSPKAGRELGRFRPLEQQKEVFSPPAVAGGRLYVRDLTTLACYELMAR